MKTKDNNRAAAIEILINTPRVMDLILKGDISGIKEAMQAGEQYDMQTFDQALFKMWENGLIDDIEALRSADSANNMRLNMKIASIGDEHGDNKMLTDDTDKLELNI